MTLLTRWWFWILFVPIAAGTFRYLLWQLNGQIGGGLDYALLGQSIGALLPVGLCVFGFVLGVRFLKRKMQGDV